MALYTGTFDAPGEKSAEVTLKPSESVEYSFTTSALTGSVVIERVLKGRSGWEAIASYTATQSATIYKNRSSEDETVRLRCEELEVDPGAETVDYTLDPVALELLEAVVKSANGQALASLDDAGNVVFPGGVIVEGALSFEGAISSEANLTITNSAPSIVLADSTTSAKDLTIAVDANKAQLRESAGGAGSLLVLDLSNNRVGVATASPAVALDVTGVAQVSGNLLTGAGVGAKNGATVSVVEHGSSAIHKTVLTLASTPVTVANTSGASFGGVKLYDFPEGLILILGVTANLSFDWSASGIAADGSGDFSLGTTITADATLDGTDVNLLPSTGLTDPFVAGVGVGVGPLDASVQLDGTGGAIDANLNIIIDDADVDDLDSDIVLVSGTVTMSWINLGDY